MMKLLKFLLTYKFRIQKLPQKKGGFTLLELLVGLVLAFLVITPLLGFMINIMTSDRQEQAKASSEQEIQTALDYIGRDLAQAIFIYDGFGLSQISDQLPDPPADTEGAPVLVFWKREFIPDALPKGDDAYLLSLVAYYLIKDTACTNSSSWSCTTRIGRVQLKDGIPDPNVSPNPDASGTTTYISNYEPSPGFNKFGSLPPGVAAVGEEKMNSWEKSDKGNINDSKNKIETLIDFVDQSPSTTAGLNITPCSTDGRNDSDRPDAPNPLPANYNGLTVPYTYRQVPNYTGTGAVPTSLQTGSFYACVNTDKTLAQVFIRGNASARIKPKTNPPTYSASKSADFPKASIQVQGRGLIKEQPGS